MDTEQDSLREALKRIEGQGTFTRRYQPRPVDVVKLRRRLKMRQKQFAARFGIPVATLRHWERGERAPRGPALTLLNLIARNPRAVMWLLPLPPVGPPPPPRVHDWEGLSSDFGKSDALD